MSPVKEIREGPCKYSVEELPSKGRGKGKGPKWETGLVSFKNCMEIFIATVEAARKRVVSGSNCLGLCK